VAVLVAAVACLGLTMCARTQKPPPPKQTQTQTQTQQQPPPQASDPNGAPMQVEEGDMAKRKPTYFPASKAPGGMYQQR